jgi:uncharacterized protein YkwD
MRPKTPTLLIGVLLLLGGGWWIGVAAIVTSHWPAAYVGHAGSPSVAALPSGDATAGALSGDFAARIIARTNQYRVEHGCHALVPNPILMHTAQAHSADMATHDFVGHNSSSGATIGQRIKAAGYTYTLVAENIAWGQQTPEQVVDLWFNESPPNDAHRRNILNCQLREIGVGYVYLASDPGKVTAHTYWTEDFGTRPAP